MRVWKQDIFKIVYRGNPRENNKLSSESNGRGKKIFPPPKIYGAAHYKETSHVLQTNETRPNLSDVLISAMHRRDQISETIAVKSAANKCAVRSRVGFYQRHIAYLSGDQGAYVNFSHARVRVGCSAIKSVVQCPRFQSNERSNLWLSELFGSPILRQKSIELQSIDSNENDYF